jgi:hypothetical protein
MCGRSNEKDVEGQPRPQGAGNRGKPRVSPQSASNRRPADWQDICADRGLSSPSLKERYAHHSQKSSCLRFDSRTRIQPIRWLESVGRSKWDDGTQATALTSGVYRYETGRRCKQWLFPFQSTP